MTSGPHGYPLAPSTHALSTQALSAPSPSAHALPTRGLPIHAPSLAVATAEEVSGDRPEPLRLRLKPKAPPTGYVDGGWWPHSRDLTVELEPLAHVLGVRLGRVTRVAYSLSFWDKAPARITVDGRVIRLEGFGSQDEYVVHLSGPDRQRISVLVVPPEATTSAAHDAMMKASQRGNADLPVEILTTGGALPATAPRLRLVRDDEQARRHSDGDHAPEGGQ
jgi:hypothetical protein